ncbi:MAG: hypothetical protein AAGI71_11695, partial [Bacteroidota bacterium]
MRTATTLLFALALLFLGVPSALAQTGTYDISCGSGCPNDLGSGNAYTSDPISTVTYSVTPPPGGNILINQSTIINSNNPFLGYNATDALTIVFSAPVNVSSIVVCNLGNGDDTYTLTPSPLNANVPASQLVTVLTCLDFTNLAFVGVTEVAITRSTTPTAVKGIDEVTLDASLPVELVSFDVLADQRDAILRWQTASETVNAGFDVEHQAPGRDAFQAVAFVEGNGTTTEAHFYQHR